jgi:hypothetical protein
MRNMELRGTGSRLSLVLWLILQGCGSDTQNPPINQPDARRPDSGIKVDRLASDTVVRQDAPVKVDTSSTITDAAKKTDTSSGTTDAPKKLDAFHAPDLSTSDAIFGDLNHPDAPLPPTCSDTIKNGTETDVDCGGNTCSACDDEKSCLADTDCKSSVCDVFEETCSAPTCTDEVKNGAETDVDCGGNTCDPCEDDQKCLAGTDCTSGVCDLTAKTCSIPTCTDKVKNGTETDTDCGGDTCGPCDTGKVCLASTDCISNICDSTSETCSAPSCIDEVMNGTETDIDCGGKTCDPCEDDQGCLAGTDCTSLVCDSTSETCSAPSCTDEVKNDTETDIDCGGDTCEACGNGKACVGGIDCTSGVCDSTTKTCIAPACTDKVKNGTETDTDCGGAQCSPCADGKKCLAGTDCTSFICDPTAKTCSAPSCTDKVKNGIETDVDCGGSCGKCLYGKTCGVPQDCQSGVCTNNKCIPKIGAWTVLGTTDACHTAPNGYTTIPEMAIDFTLDGDYVVLTEFDINVVGAGGNSAAFLLSTDGTPDPQWTNIKPEGGGDEDDHVHLFRIDALSAGSHKIEAMWGEGNGTMCNYTASNNYLGGTVWMRKTSVLAIPTTTGVKWGYKHGTTNACITGSAPYTPIPEMSMNFSLDKDSIVLSEVDMNWVGPNGGWIALRMVGDDVPDVRWTHSQPEGGADESDHMHLSRFDFMNAGQFHNIRAEWGDGAQTMCNSVASAKSWDRRIGYIAIPSDTGALYSYNVGQTNACRTPSAYAAIPDMNMSLFTPVQSIALTHFDMNWVGCNGCWVAARLETDGAPEARWTHSQPEGGADEDDHLHQHRLDSLAAGLHTFTASWGDGSGTVCNYPAQGYYWTRRIGTLLLPLVP